MYDVDPFQYAMLNLKCFLIQYSVVLQDGMQRIVMGSQAYILDTSSPMAQKEFSHFDPVGFEIGAVDLTRL